MMQAIAGVVHKKLKPKEALDLFETLKAQGAPKSKRRG
jgi:hypothetical protein